jgi:O-succinylbenzoate synthase
MRVEQVELRRLRLPLVIPFRTSFGVQTERDVLLVRVRTPDGDGWGECVALAAPVYSSEYIDGAHDVLRRFFVPAVLAAPDLSADGISPLLSSFLGHRMAKTALQLAVLDVELRVAGESLAERLGAVRDAVDCGVSVGITADVPSLVDLVGGYVAAGYRRVKLKIEPGWDVEPVRAVREAFPDVPLQVDANTAYSRTDIATLAALDPFDLLLIEQPLPEDDLLGHAWLAARITTPICLDESITSALVAEQAIEVGACRIVNIKAGRVGGYLEAKAVHDTCTALGVPVWCGGMLETGIGRAANLALAGLPGFTLPGDTSASGRYYERDITEPFVLDDGRLPVPKGPGIGVEPDLAYLEHITEHVETLNR